MFIALLPLTVFAAVPPETYPQNPHPNVADTACPEGWHAASVSCFGTYKSTGLSTTCDPITGGQNVWKDNIEIAESDGGYGGMVTAMNKQVFTKIFGEFGWGNGYLRHNPCGESVEFIPRRAVKSGKAFDQKGAYYRDGRVKIKTEINEANPIRVRVVDKMEETGVAPQEDLLRALDVNDLVYQKMLDLSNFNAKGGFPGVDAGNPMSVCSGAGSFPICFRRTPDAPTAERRCTVWVKQQVQHLCSAKPADEAAKCEKGVLKVGWWKESMWGLCVESNGFEKQLKCTPKDNQSQMVQYATFWECKTNDQAYFVEGNGHNGYWDCQRAVLAEYGDCNKAIKVDPIADVAKPAQEAAKPAQEEAAPPAEEAAPPAEEAAPAQEAAKPADAPALKCPVGYAGECKKTNACSNELEECKAGICCSVGWQVGCDMQCAQKRCEDAKGNWIKAGEKGLDWKIHHYVCEIPSKKAEVAQPAQEAAQPAQEAAQPAQEAAKPAEEAAQPAQEVAKPAEEAAKPAQEVAKPAEEAVAPDTGCPGGALTCEIGGVNNYWAQAPANLCSACENDKDKCHSRDKTWNGEPQHWYDCVAHCNLYVDPTQWFVKYSVPAAKQIKINTWHEMCKVPAQKRRLEAEAIASPVFKPFVALH